MGCCEWVGCGVWIGEAVGAGVAVGFGAWVGCDVGAIVGAVGAVVGAELGVDLATSVGSTLAGGTLRFTAVVVLDAAGPAGDEAGDEAAGDATAGDSDDGGVSNGVLDAGGLVGDGPTLGDWPTAVFPFGCAGPTRGDVGMPNVPTANAIVARARFRIPRATTRRARWTDVTRLRLPYHPQRTAVRRPRGWAGW
jgi:hypothetical protein